MRPHPASRASSALLLAALQGLHQGVEDIAATFVATGIPTPLDGPAAATLLATVGAAYQAQLPMAHEGSYQALLRVVTGLPDATVSVAMAVLTEEIQGLRAPVVALADDPSAAFALRRIEAAWCAYLATTVRDLRRGREPGTTPGTMALREAVEAQRAAFRAV